MYCNIKESKIYYECFGEGKPIIILHGCGEDHQLMTGCMEPVFENYYGYKRIYLDLPGMGKSDAPRWINNSDDILDTIISCIDMIIPQKNFIIVGQSYGGYLATGIVKKMSNRVDGMLLICPVVIAEHSKRNCPAGTVTFKDEEFFSSLPALTPQDFFKWGIVQTEYTYRRFLEEIEPGLKAANNTFIENFQKKYTFSFDLDSSPKTKYDKPVLFILGRQDSCVGYSDQWNILKNYSHATFAVLDGAGHNLQIERPQVFNALVTDWLNRIENK